MVGVIQSEAAMDLVDWQYTRKTAPDFFFFSAKIPLK